MSEISSVSGFTFSGAACVNGHPTTSSGDVPVLVRIRGWFVLGMVLLAIALSGWHAAAVDDVGALARKIGLPDDVMTVHQMQGSGEEPAWGVVISSATITDAQLQRLYSHPRLTALTLRDSQIVTAESRVANGAATPSQFVNLEMIDCRTTIADPVRLETVFPPSGSLTRLVLRGDGTPMPSVEFSRSLKNVVHVECAGSRLDDRLLQALPKSKLQYLDLSNTRVKHLGDDAAWTDCPVSIVKVGGTGIDRLHGLSSVTRIRGLWLDELEMTADMARELTQMPSLRTLSLRGCSLDMMQAAKLSEVVFVPSLGL